MGLLFMAPIFNKREEIQTRKQQHSVSQHAQAKVYHMNTARALNLRTWDLVIRKTLVT